MVTATVSCEGPVKRTLVQGTTVVNLLGTSVVSKPPGAKGKSWIAYYKEHARASGPLMCCAVGCPRMDNIAGSHVKIASGPTAAALLHTRWYIVPACPLHNKRSSCKTYAVKQVLAVEAAPALGDRLLSWKADMSKLARTLVGKR